ncbi:hypothetical protein D3C76_1516340 [compost metagenome]
MQKSRPLLQPDLYSEPPATFQPAEFPLLLEVRYILDQSGLVHLDLAKQRSLYLRLQYVAADP